MLIMSRFKKSLIVEQFQGNDLKRLQNIRYLYLMLAELWHAKRACGAPWVSKSTHPRKFGNHETVHRPPARPPAARPSAPQGNQCSITHFLASLETQEH